MKNIQRISVCLLLAGVMSLTNCSQKVKWPALPVEDIAAYYSDAAKTKTIDTAYYEILNATGEKIGTVLFSSPFSDDVKGFNGPTPLMIAMDAEGRIKDVVLLENQETPRFAQRVVEGGLYDAWDGLTYTEALDKEVDAISGATYTSTGVKESLIARLKAYEKQMK